MNNLCGYFYVRFLGVNWVFKKNSPTPVFYLRGKHLYHFSPSDYISHVEEKVVRGRRSFSVSIPRTSKQKRAGDRRGRASSSEMLHGVGYYFLKIFSVHATS